MEVHFGYFDMLCITPYWKELHTNLIWQCTLHSTFCHVMSYFLSRGRERMCLITSLFHGSTKLLGHYAPMSVNQLEMRWWDESCLIKCLIMSYSYCSWREREIKFICIIGTSIYIWSCFALLASNIFLMDQLDQLHMATAWCFFCVVWLVMWCHVQSSQVYCIFPISKHFKQVQRYLWLDLFFVCVFVSCSFLSTFVTSHLLLFNIILWMHLVNCSVCTCSL